MSKGSDDRAGRYSEQWWANVSRDISDYGRDQQETWGDIDENLLARFVNGKCSEVERKQVERAMREFPSIREAVEIGREIEGEINPLIDVDVPELDLPTPQTWPLILGPAGPVDADRGVELKPWPASRSWAVIGWSAAAILLGGVTVLLIRQHALEKRIAHHLTREGELTKSVEAYALKIQEQTKTNRQLADLLEDRNGEVAGLRKQLAKTEVQRNQKPLNAEPPKPVIVQDDPPRPVKPSELDLAQGKVEEALGIKADLPLAEKIRSAERQADAMADVPADSPQLLMLRRYALMLRLDAFVQVTGSKSLVKLLNRTKPVEPAAVEQELKTQVARVDQAFTTLSAGSAVRPTRLLCLLPPGLREGAVKLYGETQQYALAHEGKLDPVLLDFLVRARRPGDQLGLIIPACFQLSDEAGKQRWDLLLAMANNGVPIKAIMNYGTENAGPDPVYFQAFTLAKAQGIEILGYVNCDGGGKNLQKSKEEVAKWQRLYPGLIAGIFFDNQSRVDDAKIAYFAELFSFARSLDQRYQIIGCPVTASEEACLNKTGADILCRLADNANLTLGDWECQYDPSRFAVMINGVENPAQVPLIIEQAAAKHFSWIYVSNDAGVTKQLFSPWPGYLPGEIGVIAEINAVIQGIGLRVRPSRPEKSRAKR